MNYSFKSQVHIQMATDERREKMHVLVFPRCFSVHYQVALIPFCMRNSHLYENPERNESTVLAVLEKMLSQLYYCKIYKN